MALESLASTTSGSGVSSRRWRRATRSKAPESASRWSRRSSRHAAAASRSNQRQRWARRSDSFGPKLYGEELAHEQPTTSHPARRGRRGRRDEREARVREEPDHKPALRGRERRRGAGKAAQRRGSLGPPAGSSRSQYAPDEWNRIPARIAQGSGAVRHSRRRPDDVKRRSRQSRGIQFERRRVLAETGHLCKFL